MRGFFAQGVAQVQKPSNKIRIYKNFIRQLQNSNIPPLDSCIKLLDGTITPPKFIESCTLAEKYYWIGNIYTSLIPASRKKELAAHFTPPHIAKYAISRAEEFGLDLLKAKIIDPAAGGAAFLTPITYVLIKRLRATGSSKRDTFLHLSKYLSGIEIDKNLAKLSGLFLNDLIINELGRCDGDLTKIIAIQDSIVAARNENNYDAIISNPPYGRIFSATDYILNRYADCITDKHVNKYALFTRFSINWVKPGGFIVLLLPTSFIAGPYFSNLRQTILNTCKVLTIDMIENRDRLFMDVLQDTCILILQKNDSRVFTSTPSCRLVFEDGTFESLGEINIPKSPSTRAWVLPSELNTNISTIDYFDNAYSRITDYGYGIRAGYFVWNRQKDRSREGKTPKKNEVPLLWAHAIKANKPCKLSTHRKYGNRNLFSFVRFENNSSSLIRQPSILLQRTSNRKQSKRLIAGYIPRSLLKQYGSVISENHTILVFPIANTKQIINYKQMCKLLNSRPVDLRYRQISGTTTVSVKLLNEMALPDPQLVKIISGKNYSSDIYDSLVENCYRESTVNERL